ncbi:MAG TPA: Dabb family protein [Candidatus Acidoferrales bacterium]|nr:Dabb family protein [Candidatus Acidoferrales bacterium]
MKLAAALAWLLAISSVFASGYVVGQHNVGQPKTVIHAVSIQWKPSVSQADRNKVLAGVKKMAEATPGVKNIWIKTERVEPRGFDDGFAIEFKDSAAADAYVLNLAHKNWNDIYFPLRASSIAIDVSNP